MTGDCVLDYELRWEVGQSDIPWFSHPVEMRFRLGAGSARNDAVGHGLLVFFFIFTILDLEMTDANLRQA